ncbi:hypothetical protein GCM10011519_32740 [Marmoricola endophyticus]|uniref:AB hydrolase-1 domain-containing protein n=1 Tax=Marmoricola endophyticus TaxID=2040280 RepID=A0A917F8C0_9ACTN|nr:alpha/beta hydrolase [Marmoricola endophyticus]GGF56246.1 hypothetical protein GCM10011519_32740 [Marmoricola endophyticus]
MTTLTPGPGAFAAPGGDLAYEVWAGTTEPVLAVHGLSAQRRLWDWLRTEDPDLSLVAPDLRGRGDSVGVAGPSSVVRHAEDLVLLLDHLGLDRVHVVGMSMGGFVAVHLAVRHPERVRSLVLVDGGFPMAAPDGLTRENVAAAFADRTGRLERTWTSVEEYRDYVVPATAPLLDPADPLLLDYLAHDLREGRVRLDQDAMVADATSVFFGETPWRDLEVPVRFLHAQWSTGRDTAPAYPPDLVTDYAPRTVETVGVDGVDHAGTIMTPTGAAAVAALLRHALQEPETR